MLNAKEVGGAAMKKTILDAGVYPGRLVQVIDMGLQEQRDWQGEKKGPQYELMTTYEFSDEFMEDEEGNELKDKPRWLSETFPFHNLGAEKAKSTLRYRALDPAEEKQGAWGLLLGTPCNITVIVNAGKGKNQGKFYENIAGIAPMRVKDVEKCPALVNSTKLFDLDAPDMDVFKALPEWIRDKIKGNLEFNGSPLAMLLGAAAAPAVGDGAAHDVEPITEDQDYALASDMLEDAKKLEEELPF